MGSTQGYRIRRAYLRRAGHALPIGIELAQWRPALLQALAGHHPAVGRRWHRTCPSITCSCRSPLSWCGSPCRRTRSASTTNIRSARSSSTTAKTTRGGPHVHVDRRRQASRRLAGAPASGLTCRLPGGQSRSNFAQIPTVAFFARPVSQPRLPPSI